MIENNSQENLIDSNENKSFNLVNDFYSPLLNSRNLYLDNTYKFLVENNTDPAEYLGVQKILFQKEYNIKVIILS